MYINKAVDVPDQVNEPIVHRFEDFQLAERIVERVKARGFTTPTPIQDKTIPLICSGRDVIGVAATGTGKTAAFLLPLINKFLKDPTQKSLIIVPTRELAVQINEELRIFTEGMRIFSALCVGGQGYGNQLRALRNQPQFIIGTPGRLKDHFQSRAMRLDNVANLVLDEADRMVEMGFIKDVRTLIAALPKARQSLFFSATITSEVQRLIQEFTNNPESVSVKKRETSQNVDQDIIHFTDPLHRMTLLHDLLTKEECTKVLVFGRTKHGVEKLSQALVERGFSAVSIHGNKNQAQRQRALDEFKGNKFQVLVATDVAARGLDIPDVSHVINFDAPESYSDYIHRIGRTGRADKTGKAFTFVGLV
ncbi:MAG: DEAD/DEAH box helicase [Candidatus Berkelbacteria bacterium]|nr:MAG: DEAD/DEAH box helicase [Candidatus Berkelbacteria bacterium]QQG51952.1 MAG: DEAD/DEAH box helicase [Candidatus Berkelbacteria bacterium]